MHSEAEQQALKIQAEMPTPFVPLKYSSHLLGFLGHYHKVWLEAGNCPEPNRSRMRDVLQDSMKSLAGDLYNWIG